MSMPPIVSFARASFALALVASSSVATAQDDAARFHVEGRGGIAMVDEGFLDDKAGLVHLGVAYRGATFGVNAGVLRAGDFRSGIDLRDAGGTASSVALDVDGVTLGVDARVPVGERWSFNARAGVLAWDASTRVRICDDACNADRFSRDGTDFFAGIGVARTIGDRWQVGAAWDFYRIQLKNGRDTGDPDVLDIDTDLDLGTLSATVDYAF